MRKSQDLWVCTSVTEFIETLRPRVFPIAEKKIKRHVTEYIDVTATLDIEDYATAEDGYIYSIAVCLDNERLVLRYIEDVIDLFDRLEEEFELSENRRLVVYVHNLGHEHFHMTQILAESWGRPTSLFTKPRKPLTIRYDNGIEFRDSLKLFQKSLAGATKGCKHAKMVGDLDYSKHFTPDAPLSPDEWNYIVNDVQGLYEAIERLKKEHGYTQANIPLTNTGMVIEAVNARIRQDGKTLRAMNALTLSKDQLALAYKCMAGGDTHGCRWRAGRVYNNCNSYDLKSAHPSQQILRKFPSGKPFSLPADTSLEDLEMLINNGYGWLGRVFVSGVHIKAECPDPTVSISKCEDVEGLQGVDNGRMLGCTAAIIYMDSNDWQRFRQAYDYDDMVGIEILAFELKYLPDAFRGAILEFFKIKEGAEDGPERIFAKICVNTIFGACAQKVIRDEYAVDIGEIMTCEKTSWEDNLAAKSDEKVAKAQQKKFPFLWGLWTASLTRLYLFRLQQAVGWEKVIYWDTDSVKYEGGKIPAVDFYNAGVREECENRSAVVQNHKGKNVYIGTAEDEHPMVAYGYRRFTFLHAKCYAAESWNPKKGCYEIETTIAGVRKENGRLAMNGDIANLSDGLFIADAGGLALTYHDSPVRERTEWSRKTKTASWVEMNPRQYLVQTGIPDQITEEIGEIIAE